MTGWQWIEGSCYYFDPAEGADNGKMYKGAVTPDGFIVDVQGRWVDKDGTVRHDKQGLSATETEEAASRTGKSSTGSVSGSGSGSSAGNTGSDSTNTSTDSLVKENMTKIMLVDSLATWLPLVFEEGYSLDNCVITVDG